MNLIVNAGSATYKYSVFEGEEKLCELIYQLRENNKFELVIRSNNLEQSAFISKRNFENSLQDFLSRNIIESLLKDYKIQAVGFRVVHGGQYFRTPTKLTPSVQKKLKEIDSLAPLHNPPTRKLIEESRKIFPRTPIWLFFDSAFHADMPEVHTKIALPETIVSRHHMRRYGFHGIAYQSVVNQLKRKRKLPKKLIACHLGSGCSVAAIRDGKSIDTSMGFTPLEGLLMGTRAGDLDPGLLSYLMTAEKVSSQKLNHLLSFESGLKALTGTSDMRLILATEKLKPSSKLALQIFAEKVAKTIASYIVSLQGVDRIVFSGGIGEHSPVLRERIIDLLSSFGVRIHRGKNLNASAGDDINKIFSKAKICFLHVDEAAEINRELLSQ